MNEEKSMVEYKESRGIFGWLKSKFEKLKEKIKPTKNISKTSNKINEGQELFEGDLDKVNCAIPFEFVDENELMSDLGIKEPKSWDLTKEQKEVVEEGFEEIRTA